MGVGLLILLGGLIIFVLLVVILREVSLNLEFW